MSLRQARLHACCSSAIFCFLLVLPSAAQEVKTGRYTGHVVDEAGTPVPRASVLVRRYLPFEENVKLTTHSDGSGIFKLELSEGAYDVLVISPGFLSSLKAISILSGNDKREHWRLKPEPCELPQVNCDSFQ